MELVMCSKNKNLSKISKILKIKFLEDFLEGKNTVSEFFKKWTNQMKLNREKSRINWKINFLSNTNYKINTKEGDKFKKLGRIKCSKNCHLN